ncbi:hypothetical protein BCT11_20430 [Vibrio sp. 10N.222.52.B12]|uniref:hypothetical protein n=1 Tax=Vibrio sp. 10N.222.52.B12 TaxID=1880840 RepID=UPI000C826387|nr:hypothetical protein [Vibrio sp. 10N.222.52.B12]PMO36772.1 hypothetical protein BCT11_20430 [Vibrio sp. 10N.222.52.B12]
MTYCFKDELSRWVDTRDISRKDLIALLQNNYYEEFKGLDSITLSRWFTGKSIPPIYKQFYIAKCLDIDLIEVLLRMDLSKVRYSNKHDLVISTLVRALDFSISNLSYRKVSGPPKSEIKSLTINEYSDMFKEFNHNISPLKRFYQDLQEKASDVKYQCVLIKNDQEATVGHWYGMVNIEGINGLPSFITFPQEEAERSCLIGVGYYTSSAHYFELIIQALCYYLIRYSSKKDYAYFFIVDFQPLIAFSKLVFNAEEVKYYPPKEKGSMGVYLFRHNIIKSISNPVLLKKVKEKLECLVDCDPSCNLCNLRDFRKDEMIIGNRIPFLDVTESRTHV